MTALLLGLLLSHQDRHVVKQTLANGATVYARQISGAKTFSLALGSSTFTAGESPETHGLRHMIEHLQALGSKRDLDKVLEAQGMMLSAETTRDAVVFAVTGPSDRFSVALAAVKSLVAGMTVPQEEIVAEAGTIRQELALRPWSLELVSDAWLKAFGENARDPFGDPEALSKVTVDALNAARADMFLPKRLCLVAAGDVEAEAAARQMAAILDPLPTGDPPGNEFVRPAVKESVVVGSSRGEAVGLTVGPVTEAGTLATVAAAFGLQAWMPQSTIVYTPSQRNGIVVVATKSSWNKASNALKGREGQVAVTGLSALKSWSKSLMSSPPLLAKLMASSLPVRPGFDPATIVDVAERTGVADVQRRVTEYLAAGSGS